MFNEERIMKIKTTIFALSALSMLSFGAFSAELITNEQAQNLQPIGVITASGITGSTMDIRDALNAKADKEGASAYRVIENYQNGNWHATAEIYK